MSSTGTQPAETPSQSQVSPQPIDWFRWGELALVIMITIAPSIITASYALFHPTRGLAAGANFGIVAGLLRNITSLLLVVYVLSRRGLNLKSLGLDFSRWTDWPIGLTLALVAFFVAAVITDSIIRYGWVITGHYPDMRSPRVIFAGASAIQLLVYSVSSAAFEETVVRGYVTTELNGLGWSIWLATAGSIVLQTSYHVYYGIEGALAVSGYFIVFAVYYAVFRRLWPVILGHLLVDFAAISLSYLR